MISKNSELELLSASLNYSAADLAKREVTNDLINITKSLKIGQIGYWQSH